MSSVASNNRYILGVDGGGTKTIGRIIKLNTNEQWQACVGPASLTNDFDLAVTNCQRLVEQLLSACGARREEVVTVMGLAGAGNQEKAAIFTEHLSTGFRGFEVCTDAKTSLYGANAGEPVVVISLGTGSVGATLAVDGQSTLKGGWGFTVGDEGSGAKLGVLIIQSVLSELETQDEVMSALTQAVCQKISQRRDKLIEWSTLAKPIDFADLAPLVFEQVDTCSLAKTVLAQHVKNVENLIEKTRGNYQLPVVLLGGLAQPTMPYLNPLIQELIMSPKGNSLDGACFLAKQLLNKENKENT
ncbi:BadF/BadG/BcrA/BcrD ATPase family protein [Thalassotalea marina]|uniref:N-acetylglucosamine kinase n=1 Tax=Thalassotalea marina TaxID=1673741 RepID=A0A919BEU6_9GAMM|nr:BadF/BadG/BcrA/BcrD ATPase family protein [Thalassotalea marina]GHF83423.1 N-acetylglucosamine kinase [Thalassotalea marina]